MTDTHIPCRFGVRGFTHRIWNKSYYSAGLPPEWRYTFYSHRQTGLLIPAAVWRRRPELLAVWREESPPAFRPVLELPMAALYGDLPEAAGDNAWLLGYLVRAGRGLSVRDIERLAQVCAHMPVTVDIAQARERVGPALAAAGIGLCGRPARGWPAQGPLAVSLLGSCDRTILRTAIGALLATAAPAGRALFFTEPQTALAQIEEAHVLADFLHMQPPG